MLSSGSLCVKAEVDCNCCCSWKSIEMPHSIKRSTAMLKQIHAPIGWVECEFVRVHNSSTPHIYTSTHTNIRKTAVSIETSYFQPNGNHIQRWFVSFWEALVFVLQSTISSTRLRSTSFYFSLSLFSCSLFLCSSQFIVLWVLYVWPFSRLSLQCFKHIRKSGQNWQEWNQ